ncbi:MAG: glycosyltransferase [Treponema sp.]|nr:glycosyltransferase [Treponema sp.]
MKKITFLTGHSWKSNRLGGFHQFARAACELGIEVVFFSFPRPYYSFFMHQELYNRKSIRALSKGISYAVGSSTLLNITLPTFKLPNKANKFLSDEMMNRLERLSLRSFRKFARTYFSGTDVFVFESSDGMIFLDELKSLFPDAKMVYRPSDPLMYDGALSRYVKNEMHTMMSVDMNIIVNNEGLELYRRKIPDFDEKVRYELLSNGVDISSYEKKYDCPELLKKPNTILYVGAWEVEWNLLFHAAAVLPDCNFVVVLPNYPSSDIQKKAAETENLFYVPGSPPEEVPAWITNCAVVMVPYVTGFYENRPLGITAKYYQAMAAKKPIVAYSDTPKLSEVGVCVTYSYDDFISEVKKAVGKKECSYEFNLADRKWETITARFLEILGENHD